MAYLLGAPASAKRSKEPRVASLRLGFNPNLNPVSRRRLHEGLREVVDVAVRLEYGVVELSLTTSMYELGLRTIFDSHAIEILQSAPIQFHLNVFNDSEVREWPTLSDINAYTRSIALRQFVQIVEFFEHRHPMGMYVVHPGRRIASDSTHLDSMRESFITLHTLFPGLPIAIENTREGAVLSEIDSVLSMLDTSPDIRFALHTGHAFHSVDSDPIAFEIRMDYLQKFADRLAEIRWHNTAPGKTPSVPLHVALERGLDITKLMGVIGRNPGTIHMIDTVGLNPVALLREARTLHRAIAR